MGDWVRIGAPGDFREGRGRAIDLDGKKVAVFRTAGGWVAFGDTCPHMGASLADGRIVGGHVECPWHEWRYDLATGRNDKKAWACVPVYEIKVEGDDVLVKRPDPPPPSHSPDNDESWVMWDPSKHLKRR